MAGGGGGGGDDVGSIDLRRGPVAGVWGATKQEVERPFGWRPNDYYPSAGM